MPLKIPGLTAAASLRRRTQLLLSSAATTRGSSLLFSTTTQTPPPAAHFMTQYLMSNCGFSPSDAAKHSDHLSHLTSTSKPDAVLDFLRGLGLDGASLRSVISCRPAILVADVANTLKPKLTSLRAAGFSDTDITDLVAANPSFLLVNFLPKLQLLGAYLPSKADLHKALLRDPTLIWSNLSATLVPNSALLRAHGTAARDIAHTLVARPWLLTRTPPAFKELFDRVVALGFRPGTTMFLHALHALNGLSKETFRSKVDMFKSLGWSEAEFNVAFLRAPNFVACSDGALRAKMRFLVEEAGLEPRDVAERPLLLMFSLERRLVPRHRVHRILKAEGLRGSKSHLFSIVKTPEKRFLEEFVLPHLDRVPALREMYPAACLKTRKSGVVVVTLSMASLDSI